MAEGYSRKLFLAFADTTTGGGVGGANAAGSNGSINSMRWSNERDAGRATECPPDAGATTLRITGAGMLLSGIYRLMIPRDGGAGGPSASPRASPQTTPVLSVLPPAADGQPRTSDRHGYVFCKVDLTSGAPWSLPAYPHDRVEIVQDWSSKLAGSRGGHFRWLLRHGSTVHFVSKVVPRKHAPAAVPLGPRPSSRPAARPSPGGVGAHPHAMPPPPPCTGWRSCGAAELPGVATAGGAGGGAGGGTVDCASSDGGGSAAIPAPLQSGQRQLELMHCSDDLCVSGLRHVYFCSSDVPTTCTQLNGVYKISVHAYMGNRPLYVQEGKCAGIIFFRDGRWRLGLRRVWMNYRTGYSEPDKSAAMLRLVDRSGDGKACVKNAVMDDYVQIASPVEPTSWHAPPLGPWAITVGVQPGRCGDGGETDPQDSFITVSLREAKPEESSS